MKRVETYTDMGAKKSSLIFWIFFFSTMGKKKFLYLYFISVVDSCEVFMWVLVPPSLSVVVVILFVIAAST